MDAKKSTALLGLAFVAFLGLSYAENLFFFGILGDILQNQFLAVAMLFLHNILVVSLILLGMTFYVNLVVLNFFKREKHADVIITHPRSFAVIFACMIVFLSILRGATLIYGCQFNFEPLQLGAAVAAAVVECNYTIRPC